MRAATGGHREVTHWGNDQAVSSVPAGVWYVSPDCGVLRESGEGQPAWGTGRGPNRSVIR